MESKRSADANELRDSFLYHHPLAYAPILLSIFHGIVNFEYWIGCLLQTKPLAETIACDSSHIFLFKYTTYKKRRSKSEIKSFIQNHWWVQRISIQHVMRCIVLFACFSRIFNVHLLSFHTLRYCERAILHGNEQAWLTGLPCPAEIQDAHNLNL